MKNKILLSLVMLSINLSGFCTVWTINNSGNTFTPATITINLGDTVVFDITSSHDAKEVSQATYNSNGNTPMSGGFQMPFGGGMVLPAELAVGTHYFVCTPHAALGMKGTIIVEGTTGISENELTENLSIYPNPSNGIFNIKFEGTQFAKNTNVEVYNVLGKIIYKSTVLNTKSVIDLSNQKNGVYFVKIQKGETVLTKKIILE